MNTIAVRAVLFFLFAATLWLQFSLWFNADDGKTRIAKIQQDITKMQQTNDKLRINNDIQRTRLHDLKNNPQHTEDLARELLLMIKKDEIYILPLPREN